MSIDPPSSNLTLGDQTSQYVQLQLFRTSHRMKLELSCLELQLRPSLREGALVSTDAHSTKYNLEVINSLHNDLLTGIRWCEKLIQKFQRDNTQSASTSTEPVPSAATSKSPLSESHTQRKQFRRTSATEQDNLTPDLTYEITSFIQNIQSSRYSRLAGAGRRQRGQRKSANEQHGIELEHKIGGTRVVGSMKEEYPEQSFEMFDTLYEDLQKTDSLDDTALVEKDLGEVFYEVDAEEGQKRVLDDSPGNGEVLPPSHPSKRIRGGNPRPSKFLGEHLACPFAKADPISYPSCVTIGRMAFSGVKEHCKLNHFNKILPNDVRAARTWNELFVCCIPNWGRKPYPNSRLNMTEPLKPSAPRTNVTSAPNSMDPTNTPYTPALVNFQGNALPYTSSYMIPQQGKGIDENYFGNNATTMDNSNFHQIQDLRTDPSLHDIYPSSVSPHERTYLPGSGPRPETLNHLNTATPPQAIPTPLLQWDSQNGNLLSEELLSGSAGYYPNNMTSPYFGFPQTGLKNNDFGHTSYTLQQQNNQFSAFSPVGIHAINNNTTGNFPGSMPPQPETPLSMHLIRPSPHSLQRGLAENMPSEITTPGPTPSGTQDSLFLYEDVFLPRSHVNGNWQSFGVKKPE
ncbi:hypothetical protein TWF694_001765 [Orbilia ellipsospora]|uniref:Uncharacterized protein n=1 Tax=Orbilia ellipsospora TaxID=2528407 RepID=A0AAV9X9M6_9PEZI